MEMSVSRPAIVCRMCRGKKTRLVLVEEKETLECRRCGATWLPGEAFPSPAPDYLTAYCSAPPGAEEHEDLTALEAGLGAATALAKQDGPRSDPIAHRLTLLRRAALADRRAYAIELEYLRGRATVTQTEYALDRAEVTAEALRSLDTDTGGAYASGDIPPGHPIWDDEPDAARSYVRQEYTRWIRTERAVSSRT